jgi:hypothetical protein
VIYRFGCNVLNLNVQDTIVRWLDEAHIYVITYFNEVAIVMYDDHPDFVCPRHEMAGASI